MSQVGARFLFRTPPSLIRHYERERVAPTREYPTLITQSHRTHSVRVWSDTTPGSCPLIPPLVARNEVIISPARPRIDPPPVLCAWELPTRVRPSGHTITGSPSDRRLARGESDAIISLHAAAIFSASHKLDLHDAIDRARASASQLGCARASERASIVSPDSIPHADAFPSPHGKLTRHPSPPLFKTKIAMAQCSCMIAGATEVPHGARERVKLQGGSSMGDRGAYAAPEINYARALSTLPHLHTIRVALPYSPRGTHISTPPRHPTPTPSCGQASASAVRSCLPHPLHRAQAGRSPPNLTPSATGADRLYRDPPALERVEWVFRESNRAVGEDASDKTTSDYGEEEEYVEREMGVESEREQEGHPGGNEQQHLKHASGDEEAA
ncbi:hypothetical protein B0H14DRAFT_3880341 [Mycena olivaceomarginata]|nr:hypothetical protein B0H14DRAFT_3880341 [Mycena olivaceomarginata]